MWKVEGKVREWRQDGRVKRGGAMDEKEKEGKVIEKFSHDQKN